jgi:hypothetical protein
MASIAATDRIGSSTAVSGTYERFAGLCAVLAGVFGFLYSVAFVILRSTSLSALFLLLAGLVGTAALVAVYARLRETDVSFALWALLLGVVGAMGSVLHGGYDLANALNPPASANLDLPSQIDPRGMLIVLDATSPLVLVPALVAGFVASPVWYMWLGLNLWRGARA